MPVYKRCSRCGKRLPSGMQCECLKKRYKEYDMIRDIKEKQFYSSQDWQDTRDRAINRFNGIDLISWQEDKEIVYGETVHHIIPIKEDWNKRFDVDNLIYLTEKHHRQVHEAMKNGKRQKVIEYLFALVKNWERKYYI